MTNAEELGLKYPSDVSKEEALKRCVVTHLCSNAPMMYIAVLVQGDFVIAGNACNPNTKPHDIDVYVVGRYLNMDIVKERMSVYKSVVKVLHESRNAITMDIDHTIVQLCKYSKPTLKELVDSFDFAHIQIGMKISPMFADEDNCTYKSIGSTEVYVSDAWVKSRLLGKSWYVGSEYPLSSLLRLNKYIRYDVNMNAKVEVVKILTDIIRRGFDDYDDFKDQCDAIDLQYKDCDELRELYAVCCDKGLSGL